MSMWEIFVYFLLASLFCWWAVIPIVGMIMKNSKKSNFEQHKYEKKLKELMDSVTAAQQTTLDEQAKILEELTQMNKRIAAIEKMLREVE